MQKRGAVRNLFGVSVDRDELQNNLKQMELAELAKLEDFQDISVIGIIDRSSEDQARKHKRLPRCLESSDDESDEDSQSFHPRNQAPISSDIASPSSSSTQPTSVSSKKATINLVQQSRIPKGQKTIKGMRKDG